MTRFEFEDILAIRIHRTDSTKLACRSATVPGPNWIVVILVCFCLFHASTATALPQAQPPIVQFKPDIEAYPQNFGIAIDNRSRVFIGSTDGVLIYDGEQWQLVELPNRDIVRWIKYDGHHRMYVGGYDAFGYLEQNEKGEFLYFELSHQFTNFLNGELFADIWQIETTEEAVFFVGLNYVFRYSLKDQDHKAWRNDGSFSAVAHFQGRTYLVFRDEGLKFYREGGWHPIDVVIQEPDGTLQENQTIPARDIVALIEYTPDRLLVLTEAGPWFEYDGETFTRSRIGEGFTHMATVTRPVLLNKTTLAFASSTGKVFFYDLVQKQTSVVSVARGFIPAAVSTGNGELLAVSDLGFYAVTWPTPWKVMDGSMGISGSVHSVRLIDEALYVLTGSGAYRSLEVSNKFERLNWTDHEAWDMLPLENGEILFADSYGIKLIGTDGGITPIDSSTTARLFHRSRFNQNIIYVGTEFGIQVLERRRDGWATVFENTDMENLRISGFVETKENELWISSDRGGIQKLNFVSENDWHMNAQKFDAGHGIDYGDYLAGTSIYQSGSNIIASTGTGFYHWEGAHFTKTRLDGLEDLRPPGRTIKLVGDSQVSDSQPWGYDAYNIYRKNGSWQKEDISGLRAGALEFLAAIDGRVYAGDNGAVLSFENTNTAGIQSPQDSIPNQTNPQLVVTAIETQHPDDIIEKLVLENPALARNGERTIISFSLPVFNDVSRRRYRSKLVPGENQFTPWGQEDQRSFTDLPPNNYVLELEARDANGHLSSLSVPFSVKPFWYETSAFRVFLLVVLASLVYLIFIGTLQRRSRIIAAERDQLEEKVAERTRELQSANQQLDKMAHLDGLTQIPNRRKLDAYLQDVLLQSVERQRVMAIAIIDVDHFKKYNDTKGHLAGDQLLIELARLLSRNLRRAEDLVARYGGEEFLVVLPGAETETALKVIEGMRANVANSDLDITISAGLVTIMPNAGTEVEDMIQLADAALYKAKETGRNQVVVHTS